MSRHPGIDYFLTNQVIGPIHHLSLSVSLLLHLPSLSVCFYLRYSPLMDGTRRRTHRPSRGPASQETPYVPYQNPHRPQSPFGRSSRTSHSPVSPPLRPSSPSRHHRRTHSAPRDVKVSFTLQQLTQETLNAESQDDDGVRRVNHYILKREIGRGSFGVVHLGIDSTTGDEYV
jgi:hypothetical protein